jgi:hypothetical protein
MVALVAALDLLDFEFDRQAERVERRADRLDIGAGIDERTEDHVPADAAEAIEMCDSHDLFLWVHSS